MHEARRKTSLKLHCLSFLRTNLIVTHKKTGRVSCNDQKWKKTCINSKWNLNGDAYDDWIHHSNVDMNSFTNTLPGSYRYNRSELTCRVGTAFLAMSVRIYGLSKSRKRRMPKSGTVEMEQREKSERNACNLNLESISNWFCNVRRIWILFCGWNISLNVHSCVTSGSGGLLLLGSDNLFRCLRPARACVPLLWRIIWCAFVKRLKFYSILMSCFVFDSRRRWRWQTTVACDADALEI